MSVRGLRGTSSPSSQAGGPTRCADSRASPRFSSWRSPWSRRPPWTSSRRGWSGSRLTISASGFRNLDDGYHYGDGVRVRHFVLGSLAPRRPRGTAPAVLPNDGAELRANGTHPTVTWVGHSTFLVQLDGVNILTDPHWGERASPVGFAGPRRLVAPGLAFADLPPIHAVVISHDHYDHLDAETVDRLAREHRPRFFVPLGLRDMARGAGDHRRGRDGLVGQGRVPGADLRLHPGPALLRAHPRRSVPAALVLVDRLGPTKRFFFAGDTGYDPRFRQIGERFGPFDLTADPDRRLRHVPARAPEPRQPGGGRPGLRGRPGSAPGADALGNVRHEPRALPGAAGSAPAGGAAARASRSGSRS